jgi:hypothetical protein
MRSVIAAVGDGLSSQVSTWVAIVAAAGGLLFGTILGAIANFADRLTARRTRLGDLASVAILHEPWSLGKVQIPPTQVGPGEFVAEQDAARFPMSVVNGSGEKITNVDFGIRWVRGENGAERLAGFAAVLRPEETGAGTAWEVINDYESFEPWDFDAHWLEYIEFFVRFTDQRGVRWKNTLRHKPRPEWTSTRL